jgi:hypothetical protein
MTPTQKQFSLNGRAFQKQGLISYCLAVQTCMTWLTVIATALSGTIGVANELRITFAGHGVRLDWPDFPSPVVLEVASDPSVGSWQPLLTTLYKSMEMPLGERAQFFRLRRFEPAPDTTDYQRDRPAMAAFYQADPVAYWGSHGVPPLVRLGGMVAELGGDPMPVFNGLQSGFQPERLLQALQQGVFPPDVQARLQSLLNQGVPPWEALLGTFFSLVNDLDTTLRLEGPNHPAIAQIRNRLNQLIAQCFDLNALGVLAPQPSKPGATPVPGPGTILGMHGLDPFSSIAMNHQLLSVEQRPVILPDGSPGFVNTFVVRSYVFSNVVASLQTNTYSLTNVPVANPPPLPGDSDTSSEVRWWAISNVVWVTTYDAACAAVATGASGRKLRLLPDAVTCQQWNALSSELGATPGGIGAPQTGMAAWYNRRGYSCIQATDGPIESQYAEASKALDRGCDVTLVYYSDDNTRGHVEMVTSMAKSSDDPETWRASTLSWGQPAAVTISAGRYQNKSDGAKYNQVSPAGVTESFLAGSGRALLYYYCKQ